MFRALKDFLDHQNHNLIFVIGNHDPDLVWPKVQEFIRQKLSASNNIEFTFRYEKNGLLAEHGHLLDVFFAFNHKKPIITYRKRQVLNLPWGCRICFSHLNKIKLNFPEEEKYQPATEYAKTNPAFGKAVKKAVGAIIAKELLLRPLFFFYDPTRRAPTFKIIVETVRRNFKALSYEQYKKLDFKRLRKKYPQVKTFVFGHTHCLGEMTYRGQQYLITDTWREEINVRTGKHKPKTYALITFKDNRLESAGLKTFA